MQSTSISKSKLFHHFSNAWSPITVRVQHHKRLQPIFRHTSTRSGCCSLDFEETRSASEVVTGSVVSTWSSLLMFGIVTVQSNKAAFKVTDFGTNRKPVCDFLLVISLSAKLSAALFAPMSNSPLTCSLLSRSNSYGIFLVFVGLVMRVYATKITKLLLQNTEQ